MKDFKIIRDTREKHGQGWYFDPYVWPCDDFLIKKLDIGDYSIFGLEEQVVIERKATVAEFARNVVEARFKRELEKLSYIPNRYIILEFPWHKIEMYPEGSDIPKKKWSSIRVRGKYMLKCINTYRIGYGIHVIACENSTFAQQTAFDILRQVHERHNRSS
jgi:ERCC4-type nuclease